MRFNSFVGIPWQEMGRTKTGVDCWGLVRLFYESECGIVLPSYSMVGHGLNSADELSGEIHKRMANWCEVEDPLPGDCVLLNIGGKPIHIGIVVDVSSMLHVSKNCDSVIERFDGLKWSNRIEGFYRYVG